MDARVLLGVAHDKLHVDHLARPAVRVIHHVHIPHTEVVIRHVDQVLAQVEGALVAGEVVLAGAVLHLQVNVSPTVHHPKVPLPQGVPQLRRTAVEHQHVRVGDFLHHQLAHILGVHLKGGGVDEGHDLVQHPVGGQNLPVQPLHLPHAVVLDQHLFGVVLFLQLLQVGALQVLLVLNGDDRHVVQSVFLVLLLALFAAEQQGGILAGEAVLQDAVDEIGLAGIQKAGHQINRNVCHYNVHFLSGKIRGTGARTAGNLTFDSDSPPHRPPRRAEALLALFPTSGTDST